MSKRFLFLLLALLAVMSACTAQEAPQAATAQPTQPPATQVPPSATPLPQPTATPTTPPPSPVPSPTTPALEANPQRITFQAEDGTELVGYYYPARDPNAPVVVYAHWVAGDQRDWSELALWLQNRGAEVTDYPRAEKPNPWNMPNWFPPVPPDVSLAVFTFDFRGFGESSGQFDPQHALQDALAAYETAAGLPGVDASRMVGIGASIGADGVVDGCLLYNQAHGSGCVGAMALSPGSYLTMPFASTVTALEALDAPVPVWCLAGEGDQEAYPTCQSAAGDAYRLIGYQMPLHGMMLLLPEVEPPTLELILDFLGEQLGIPALQNRG